MSIEKPAITGHRTIEQQYNELIELLGVLQDGIKSGQQTPQLDLHFQESFATMVSHLRYREQLLAQHDYFRLAGYQQEHRKLFQECESLYLQSKHQNSVEATQRFHNIVSRQLLSNSEQLIRKLLTADSMERASTEGPPPIRNNRVLIIDDEESVLEYYGTIFNSQDEAQDQIEDLLWVVNAESGTAPIDHFEITLASQGKEGFYQAARAVAEGRPYAMAFIDMRMPPGWDGLETAIRLRELDSHIRITFVTAHHDTPLELLHQSIPSNMLFLSKPMSKEEVFQVARTHCLSWDHEQSRKESEEYLQNLSQRLEYQASHDSLTGLYNRRAFFRIMKERLVQEKSDGGGATCYLLYMNLDQFKVINIKAGHIIGDQALIDVSNSIAPLLEENDLFARLGGVEFGILLCRADFGHVEALCKTVFDEVNHFTLKTEESEFKISANIGISRIEDLHPRELQQRLAEAAISCFHAKEDGRNSYRLYEPMSDDTIQQQNATLEIAIQTQEALQEGRLSLYAQPILSQAPPPYSTTDSAQTHLEILLRMEDRSGEIRLPEHFIEPCEHYQFITTIDLWVIEESFKFLAGQSTINQRDLLIGINLSTTTVTSDEIPPFIIEQLKLYDINPKQVCLEIPERAVTTRLASTHYFMKEMHSYGFLLAIDGVGGECSDLSYLKGLPIDMLKLNGGLVTELSNDSSASAAIDSICISAESMGLQLIAQHVEDQHTLKLLQARGIHSEQGYHFGKPLPLEEALLPR